MSPRLGNRRCPTGLQPIYRTNALDFFRLFGLDADTVYLSPGAPLYHAAPHRFCMTTTRLGGTCVIMDRFDPLEALCHIKRYGVAVSQWVPTMFVRMLRLADEERSRFDLTSNRSAVHAAAPCAVAVKQAMIDRWGPIIHEYYGGSEGSGLTYISSEEWQTHPGSVGRGGMGTYHILDDEDNELPPGQPGMIFAEGGRPIDYHNDPEKTARAHSRQGYTTAGDIGCLDEDGYLYLTDRKNHMIIVGGVNIYPQETEDALIQHPSVADVAVIGVPHEEPGEEVEAIVQPVDWDRAGPALAQELIAFCQERISRRKCPRSIDFERELPRSPAVKLYKHRLRDRYREANQVTNP